MRIWVCPLDKHFFFLSTNFVHSSCIFSLFSITRVHWPTPISSFFLSNINKPCVSDCRYKNEFNKNKKQIKINTHIWIHIYRILAGSPASKAVNPGIMRKFARNSLPSYYRMVHCYYKMLKRTVKVSVSRFAVNNAFWVHEIQIQ